MRPPVSFIGQPIRSLQTMLRVLAEHNDRYVSVIPDGIYGPNTMRAVTVFQQHHGLPVTGVTDHATWQTILAAFEPALSAQQEAQTIGIVLNPNQVIRKGERSPYVHLTQAMLHTLYDVYQSVSQPSHTGILDDSTCDSLASFQQLCGLPMTGNLDKHTWKHLALQYPLAANLHNSL